MDSIVSKAATLSLKSEKRRLTTEEIEDIVSGLRPNAAIPVAIAESHVEKARTRVRSQLASAFVYPEIISDLKKNIIQEYERARIHPGESVGIVTAQSIGERQTQMTLDTFHSAGAALKTVISGVPRFSELLSASPNPKSVISKLYPKTPCASVSEVREIGAGLKYTVFGDVVQSFERQYLFGEKDGSREWYAGFDLLYGTEYQKYQHCVAFTLDVGRLYESRLELSDIAKAIEEYEDLTCTFSPTFLGEMDVYFDATNVTVENIDAYISQVLVPNLKKIQISGLKGVSAVYYEKSSDGTWFVETAGSNLVDAFNTEAIDSSKSYCNNIWEVLEVLGIEAARELLIKEFQDTVSSDGTCVNRCHIQLLVDTMTYGGSIMSISRYGQRKSKTSTLAKASFEESLDNFLKAGLKGEVDSTESVSASIMVGKLPTCGTGTFTLHLDLPKLMVVTPSALMADKVEEYNENESYNF